MSGSSPGEPALTALSLLGSTGSIGRQALEVVRQEPGRFEVVALGASSSVAQLVSQAREFRPRAVAVADASVAGSLARELPPGIEVLSGVEGLRQAAQLGDVVLNAVVGFAGLPVTLAALWAGKRLALANKESLIAGAPVVQRARRTPGAEIVPVDSEHCALHQCLRSALGGEEVARLLLTASGGPFRGRARADLAAVTVDEALAHPTWKMGPKVTVDSSTLMNKGLEVIEAHELFGIAYDRIEVLIHPQSVVHSMVEFVDGAVIAQLSEPDMRLPIGYALGFPRRLRRPFGAISWSDSLHLDFELPDREVFPCLGLAEQAGRHGGLAPAWLNAGNEVAVAAFLSGRIPWGAIDGVVADTLEAFDGAGADDAADVVEADRRAREHAGRAVARRDAA
ncbi:MAG TPA: 1-deoxy-D-xylulose-5-phosphate reductoisomerase [Acidimicrobiales bacterium]|nr:1-deoxy-D-xylulose-5-phosphate reductoisomerase [Acidimicrobiales bacterium]